MGYFANAVTDLEILEYVSSLALQHPIFPFRVSSLSVRKERQSEFS